MTFEQWWAMTYNAGILPSPEVKRSYSYTFAEKAYNEGWDQGQWQLCKEMGYRDEG